MAQQNSLKILKIATIKPSKNEQNSFINTCIRNFDGSLMNVFDASIINALAKGLGVPLNVSLPKDNTFGNKKPDGNWTGIMGLLLKEEVDVSTNGFSITDERMEAVNFAYPLHVTDRTFMTNKLEPQSKTFAMFGVYSFEVWIGVVLCIILISLFLYILLERRINYSKIIIESVGCLAEQSLTFEVKHRNSTALLLLH